MFINKSQEKLESLLRGWSMKNAVFYRSRPFIIHSMTANVLIEVRQIEYLVGGSILSLHFKIFLALECGKEFDFQMK
jgi:hypothetical protein